MSDDLAKAETGGSQAVPVETPEAAVVKLGLAPSSADPVPESTVAAGGSGESVPEDAGEGQTGPQGVYIRIVRLDRHTHEASIGSMKATAPSLIDAVHGLLARLVGRNLYDVETVLESFKDE